MSYHKREQWKLEKFRVAQQALHKQCPKCNAPINVRCSSPNGRAKRTVHKERMK